jgi:uncharacterized membrane protein YtjA (UPF0391 family)
MPDRFAAHEARFGATLNARVLAIVCSGGSHACGVIVHLQSQAADASIRRSDLLQEVNMLHYALLFLIVAIIAAVLGFGGIAGVAAGVAKILFLLFVVLFLVSLILGSLRRF